MRGAAFSGGSITFPVGTSHGDRMAPFPHNRKAESQKVRNIPGCPGDNGIEPDGSPILWCELFGSPLKHAYILYAGYPDSLFQKVCSFSAGLNEKNLPFLPGYAKDKARKPGPTPKVGKNTLPRKHVRKGERVENMLPNHGFCVMLTDEIEDLSPALKFIYI